MRTVHSRKRINTASLVALTTAATLPMLGHSAEDIQQTLPTISVTASQDSSYKANRASNSKKTQSILNTPQTIAVIDKKVISEQGASSLVQALQNTPGITMQLGENGSTSAGDSIQLRGFNIANSLYVDGIRDLGAVTRDTFNIEQIEITKGPTGSEAGRGGASGYINTQTKLPTLINSRGLSLGYTTSERTRVTTDINQQIDGGSAFRFNGMFEKGSIDGRDYVNKDSYAFAPSLAVGLGTDLRSYFYSQHVHQNNRPDGGIPTIGQEGFFLTSTPDSDPPFDATPFNLAPAVDRSNYYGSVDDYEKVDADMFTIKIEKDFASGTRLENTTRYGKTHMNRILTGIGVGSTMGLENPSEDPSTWTITRRIQGIDRTNSIAANLTNLSLSFKTGAIAHDIATGFELSRETLLNDGFTKPDASSIPKANLYSPDAYVVLPKPTRNGTNTFGEIKTVNLYLLETLHLTDWLDWNLGSRFDHYKIENTHQNIALSQSKDLLSWNTAVLLKPSASSSIYVSYANSLTPPGSTLALSTRATDSNNRIFDPQETKNIELGGKIDLFDARLAITSAIFRTENTNQVTTDPVTSDVSQEGRTRVVGIELGVIGKITKQWEIVAGLARTKTQQFNQVSIYRSGIANESTGVRWSPDLTASVWASYTIGGFKAGLGVRYVSDQYRVVSKAITETSTQPNMPKIPAYMVVDAMASYDLTPKANLALNIYNLADEEYMATLNNGGGRYTIGVPLSALLTLNLKF